MSAVRRWYIYLVCIVSLQAVAWAAISLLRDVFIQTWFAVDSAAIEIAIIVIGLPVYLVHWLWAQRLVQRDPGERDSVVRSLYLYGAMAGLLGAAIPNAFGFLDALLRLLFGVGTGGLSQRWYLSNGDRMIHAAAAMAVLGLLWLYHWRIVQADRQSAPESGPEGIIRRWYTLGFSAAGLTMASLGAIGVLRWLLFQINPPDMAIGAATLWRELARLAVGLVVWLVFWGQAQRRFSQNDEEEQASVLRKVYLYAAVFIAVVTMVTTATFVLASLFRRALHIVSNGRSNDIRTAISILVPMAVVWAYHARTLRNDVAMAGESHGQIWVRQLYRYLVAGIGLAAVLVGLGGLIGFLIRALAGTIYSSIIPEPVAWYGAVLVAGLPVWLIPWWQAQRAALSPGAAGDDESRSIVRRIYLYFFVFVATMTVLSSGVYVVSQLVRLALDGQSGGNLLANVGQAIAYSVLAVLVWLYHGTILRADGRRARAREAVRLASLRVVVVDPGDGRLGLGLTDALQRELPGAGLQPLGLSPAAEEALGPRGPLPEILDMLAEASVIVGPWTMTVARGTESGTGDEITRGILASQARKLLIPTQAEGWQWVGLRRYKEQIAIRDAVRSVKRFLDVS
jgi:Domain of unknown function (DUF5671)